MAEKKKFFDVELELINEKVKLLSYTIEQLDKRTIKLDLTRMLKGKSLEAVFQIKMENGKASGYIKKISVFPFFIRRMMRKSVSYVEDSFSCECSDSFLRMKIFLITRKKVTRAVRKALREEGRKYLQEYAKDKVRDDIFLDIIGNKIQKSLSLKLKKIYPLALCEIRKINIEKEKPKIEVEKIIEKKEEKKE
ncbi:hypothetical protein FJZ19_01670 [Candidatus Pacearchaeota archaeon]|nr:hypothetical protein [Candidatus Pacearchaeota archaeon]